MTSIIPPSSLREAREWISVLVGDIGLFPELCLADAVVFPNSHDGLRRLCEAFGDLEQIRTIGSVRPIRFEIKVEAF